MTTLKHIYMYKTINSRPQSAAKGRIVKSRLWGGEVGQGVPRWGPWTTLSNKTSKPNIKALILSSFYLSTDHPI
jgi:hypothetical protein